MPEYREVKAMDKFIEEVLNTRAFWKCDLTVQNIWADATDKEQLKSSNVRVQAGHAYKLDTSCKCMRGQKDNQTPLFPPMWKGRGAAPISSLRLGPDSVSSTGHTVTLDFGPLVLSMAPLTHTSVQCYSRSTWETAVLQIPKKDRKFLVAIGFEFKDFVLAFLSADLMFQASSPIWRTKKDALAAPPPPPDIYDDFNGFLVLIVKYYEPRIASRGVGRGLMIIQMRTGDSPWRICGIGVYSLSEIFDRAGLSPWLTEGEVIRCPSRLARLCAAFYSFAYAVRHGNMLLKLLRPCMDKDTLTIAPTVNQRLKYKDMLTVWAKAFKQSKLYDFFEPNAVRPALTLDRCNLGALIFGEKEWARLGSAKSLVVDPLTVMFRRRGLLSKRTFLTPYDATSDVGYSTLFWEPGPLEAGSKKPSGYKRRPIHAFHLRKDVWTVAHPFPDNSVVMSGKKPSSVIYYEFTGSEKKAKLFLNIVKKDTGAVAVGPLEYCGNAVPVRINGRTQIAVAAMDPNLSMAIRIREICKQLRKKYKLEHDWVRRKEAMPQEVKDATDEETCARRIRFVQPVSVGA
ncbi:hypothetical protein GLOTRDRAFT_90440 [Gloeophyllum trabeum ATCC 11539]|uniref:Uncharacterized protein n=1 Tax=Gloeophyllum trabeum (strain ATCC 11539 / FP-39264 / Madison 617) TaxID=670483 RepID=S7QNV1_GLOTA|nr:uncharacterized protein GLOTRDRAFT_90440 [Gloeophyllum trabeum ATCC 11539]EPQ61203.1 hypothetical protein GLOTRDRAFT_90440 [Gloeophyllum trabeum ATCC 11539]